MSSVDSEGKPGKEMQEMQESLVNRRAVPESRWLA